MMPTAPAPASAINSTGQAAADKTIYNQRTADERINSQAVALGIERPHLRRHSAIANQNTLIYVLINLRAGAHPPTQGGTGAPEPNAWPT